MIDGFGRYGPGRQFAVGSLALFWSVAGCGDGDAGSAPAPPPSSETPAEPVLPVGFEMTTARLIDTMGDTTDLRLWVAATYEEQAQGLMDVTDLGEADGMAFVFDEPVEVGFYMWQTPMPLTVAFFDAGGMFVNAESMKPCLDESGDDCPTYLADGPYTVALEVPEGDFDHMLVGNTRLELDPITETPDTGPAGTVPARSDGDG